MNAITVSKESGANAKEVGEPFQSTCISILIRTNKL